MNHESSKNRSQIPGPVLITGANSGIGLAITQRLASEGVQVYAGVRKPIDFEKLNGITNVHPLYLDITNPDHLQKLPRFIEKQENGLYGLVNNAGIAELGLITSHSPEIIQHHFNVNVFGHIQITNTLLPFLKAKRGRIILTGSMSGILTAKSLGLYSMGKHAIEAYSNVLRGELEATGVKVSLLEPGNFKSNIFGNLISRYEEGIHREEHQPFLQGDRIKQITETAEKEPEPDQVAEKVVHALTVDNPQPRYFIGSPVEAKVMLQGLITKLLQVNQNDHELSLEELHDLLSEVYDSFQDPQSYRFI